MEKILSINLNFALEKNILIQEVQDHLAELRLVILSKKDEAEKNLNFSSYELRNLDKEKLIKSQIRKCYKGVITSLQDYIDRLIGSVEIGKRPFYIDRDLRTEEEKINFIEEKRIELIKETSQDKKFDLPKKLDYLLVKGDPKFEIIKNYFDLRNALEHHKGIPKKDITLKFNILGVEVEGKEIKEETKVFTGQKVVIVRPEKELIFYKDNEIIIDKDDLEHIAFSVILDISSHLEQSAVNLINERKPTNIS